MTKIKQIEKNYFKTDKTHYDYDDIEYKEIRDVRNLFDLSIDKDYCKPTRSNALNALNDNYFEY